jgi:type IV pilus assembly protein PilX
MSGPATSCQRFARSWQHAGIGLRGTQSSARGQLERGASLIIGLIFLVILSVLAASSSRIGILDERMARFHRDRNLAAQAAEGALQDARADITTVRRLIGTIGATPTCNGVGYKGVCMPAASGPNVWELYLEDTTRSVQYGEATGLAASELFPAATQSGGVIAQPRYLIEPIPDIEGQSLRAPGSNFLYRITAIGYGASSGTRVVIQETYRP